MKNKQYINILALFYGFVVIAVLLFFLFGFFEEYLNKNQNEAIQKDGLAYINNEPGKLFYNSEWYTQNNYVESYLILGVDKIIEDSSSSRATSEQTDFIALLVIDKKKESIQILQLNRDTMANIPQKDISGKDYGTLRAQLALAHTYGQSERERCRSVVKTVEDLLYGIDVNHYFSITMDAVSVLNDSVGGVEISLMDDFTHLDETFQKGAVVSLHGGQALEYVRARSSLEDSSNLHRMERQKQYVGALFNKFVALEDENLLELIAKISEYLETDCTADQMTRLAERLEKYSYEGILTLPGEAVKGEQYIEYYLDEAAVQKMIVKMFYQPQK